MPAPGPSTVGPAAICEGHSLLAPTSWRRQWELQATKPPIRGHTQGSRTHESESSLPAVPGPHLLAPSPQAHWISLSKPTKSPRRVDKLLSNKTKKPHAAKCGIAPSEPDPSHHHGNSPPSPHFPTHHLRGNMATARPVGNLACAGPGEGGRSPRCPELPASSGWICTAGSTLAAVFQSGGDSGDGWHPAWCPCSTLMAPLHHGQHGALETWMYPPAGIHLDQGGVGGRANRMSRKSKLCRHQ